MHYFRFLTDYAAGLLRPLLRRGKALPYSKRACRAYFATLGRTTYQDRFFAGNSSFFNAPFRSSRRIQDILASQWSVVVEMGSGFGDLERSLNKRHSNAYVALDWSIGLLQTSRSLGGEHGRSFYVCGDAELCPLQQDLADLILIANLTPYISCLSTLAREVSRIARRPCSYLGLLYPIRNPFWEDEFGGFGLNYSHSSEIIGAFEDEGFEVLYREALYFQLVPGRRSFSQHLADYVEFGRNSAANT